MNILRDKFDAGKPAAEVLTGVKAVVEAMTFPTTMSWGRHSLSMFVQFVGLFHYWMIQSCHSTFWMWLRDVQHVDTAS
ncbi:Uncharacterised protein [Weissella viridescens]|uniref:Uncharacterized protein n=1 Tax=Weissella viridescens TaxID=1629 RepID=A0A380P7Z6_WEIVI|nr:Uncharacterised protein [Weissella viridescens]